MAAEITGTGILFNDSTSINTRGWMTPNNTAMFFYQNAAPTHWVRSESHNDKMLRVVSGTGAGTGGSISFTAFSAKTFSSPFSSTSPTGAKVLSINEIASHVHSTEGTGLTANPQNPDATFNGGDVSRGNGWSISFSATGNNSGGGLHRHPFSSSGTTPNLPMNINVQYIDILLCNFDINA